MAVREVSSRATQSDVVERVGDQEREEGLRRLINCYYYYRRKYGHIFPLIILKIKWISRLSSTTLSLSMTMS